MVWQWCGNGMARVRYSMVMVWYGMVVVSKLLCDWVYLLYFHNQRDLKYYMYHSLGSLYSARYCMLFAIRSHLKRSNVLYSSLFGAFVFSKVVC